MRGVLLLLAGLSLLPAGCGYRLQGRSDGLPGNVRSVYVEMFRNESYEPFLENVLTDEVVQRFSRHGRLQLVEVPARAEALLGGRIVRYTSRALSYNRDDDIAEYRSRLTVEAVLRRTVNGEVLWKGQASWEEDYPAAKDKVVQNDLEQAAIAVISERVADELFARMLADF